MMTGQAPLEEQRAILDAWGDATEKRGGNRNASKVVSPILVMADTDEEALQLARIYIPRWFQLQVEHYAADEKLYGNVPSYASFSATFKQRIANCNPDNLGPLFSVSLIGSAGTVRERLQRFLDVGYNYVMVQPSLPGLPHHIRQDWLTRFGRDVMPHFGRGPAGPRRRCVSRRVDGRADVSLHPRDGRPGPRVLRLRRGQQRQSQDQGKARSAPSSARTAPARRPASTS